MTQNIFPALRYRDGDTALEWLKSAFGAEAHAVHRRDDGTIQHAELGVGGGLVMLGQYDDALASTISLYLVVPDPDAHFERAAAAGARIVRELEDTPYGSREYSARDLEGNLWSFGTYDPNNVS
jgi:uncharacterized glyoxalase superfamily protein PhnB